MQGIIAFSRRFSIPLIAVTSGEKSALARAADVVLLLPKEKEACPHGLAPTTSTMMQLSIGDALAISLLEARGFSASDFRTFHPGGKLGASLTHVSEIMHMGEEIPLVGLGRSCRMRPWCSQKNASAAWASSMATAASSALSPMATWRAT